MVAVPAGCVPQKTTADNDMRNKSVRISDRIIGDSRRYRVRWYCDWSENHKEETFKSLAKAKQRKREIDAMKASQVGPGMREMKFSQLAEQYMEASKRGRDGKMPLEFSTLKGYQHYLDEHILPYIGNVRLNELTRDKVSMFMGQLTEKFTTRQTAKHAFDLSKSILNWAVARDLIVKSPAYKLAVQLNDGRGVTNSVNHIFEVTDG